MTTAAIVALGSTVLGCGDDGGMTSVTAAAVELPFELEHVDGTEPVGRPAVFRNNPHTNRGEPVHSLALRAAYRVTAEDPLDVVRAWAEQLDGLTLHKVNLEAREQGGAPNPWVRAGAVADEDLVDVQLWATGDGPILLVSIDRISDEPPRTPAVDDRMESPPAPEPADLGPTGRTDGDELFAEQGGRIHLPEGTTALTPTIPTRAGTGGSTSVVAAEDARAAIDAMLAEGLQRDPDGRVDEPEISELDGVEVITAGYWRDGGGWDFDIVAVRGPADPTATLYITSGSD